MSFMDYEFSKLGLDFKTADICGITDTLAVAGSLPGKRNNLDVLCDRYGIVLPPPCTGPCSMRRSWRTSPVDDGWSDQTQPGQREQRMTTTGDTGIRRLEATGRPQGGAGQRGGWCRPMRPGWIWCKEVPACGGNEFALGDLLLLASLSGQQVLVPSDIPLLDNRFRIDYGVKEVTFIIKRKPGTPR